MSEIPKPKKIEPYAGYMDQLGVLVTSHAKQHLWMDQAFASWAGFRGYMLLGYDHTDVKDLPLERWTPPITETFVTGKPAGYWGHHRGELWQMKAGGRILAERGCDWIYKTAADNTCFRWRNLAMMFRFMFSKHVDLVICGTTQIFGRLETFNRIMDCWSEEIRRCGGAECFMYHMIEDLKIKDIRQKIPWWHEVLGLVHLQGEYALNNQISVVDTWAIGQLWGKRYSHRDLDPRVQHLTPHIKEQYERLVQENPQTP